MLGSKSGKKCLGINIINAVIYVLSQKTKLDLNNDITNLDLIIEIGEVS